MACRKDCSPSAGSMMPRKLSLRRKVGRPRPAMNGGSWTKTVVTSRTASPASCGFAALTPCAATSLLPTSMTPPSGPRAGTERATSCACILRGTSSWWGGAGTLSTEAVRRSPQLRWRNSPQHTHRSCPRQLFRYPVKPSARESASSSPCAAAAVWSWSRCGASCPAAEWLRTSFPTGSRSSPSSRSPRSGKSTKRRCVQRPGRSEAMSAHTDNSIIIKAPVDVVWEEANRLEQWPVLFAEEYAQVDVLTRDQDRITFRITTKPREDGRSYSWVSERVLDPEQHRAVARRVETGPFLYMHIFHSFDECPEGTRVRWVQDFETRPQAPFTDEQMASRINAGSEGYPLRHKEVIEQCWKGRVNGCVKAVAAAD